MTLDHAGTVTPAGRETPAVFDLLRRWQDYLAVAGVAETTARQYRRAWFAVLADLCLAPEDVTEDDLVTYLAELPAQGGARSQTMKAAKSFYRWAVPRYLDHDPTERLKAGRKRRAAHVRAHDRDVLDRVFAAAEQIDPRARPAMELLYSTGARIAQLCEVVPADVRGGRITFRVTKGDRPYSLPLNPMARRAVDQLLDLGSYVPPNAGGRRDTLVGIGPGNLWRWVKLAGERCEPPVDIQPHDFRRSYGTELANDPRVDIRTWVSAMNHADPTQFGRYAKPREERLREVGNALFG
jgi:integrase